MKTLRQCRGLTLTEDDIFIHPLISAFLDVVRGLDVDVQELAVDPVSFSEDLSASIDKFVVMNLQLKGKSINSKYMGENGVFCFVFHYFL